MPTPAFLWVIPFLFAVTAFSQSQGSVNPSVTVSVLSRVPLPGIPSASGVEAYANRIYVIGDDSPFLYELDTSLKQCQQIRLFPDSTEPGARIPKARKPDFESMLILEPAAVPELFVFGSGSKSPERERGFRVPLAGSHRYVPSEFSLSTLYDAFRKHPDITGSGTLNIEGAAATSDHVIFLQRKSGNSRNAAILIAKLAFAGWLEHPNIVPPFSILSFDLPLLQNVPAGFSGITHATGTPNFLFSASAENTDNAIDDGTILGSLIGFFPIPQASPFSSAPHGRCIPGAILGTASLMSDDRFLPVKIEGITVIESAHAGTLTAIAVTDSDSGVSELLKLQIRFK